MSEKRILTALPVFNEVAHLREVLAQVRRYSSDILVVDDGSTDGTAELLAREKDLFVVRHETNLGYGAGIRTAFEFSIEHDYDVLVTIDCDGQHQPCLIPKLAAAVFPESGEPVDIVSGSRYLTKFEGDSTPPEARRRINMLINELLEDRLGLTLTDSFCGFKAYRVAALPRFEITELGYAIPLQFWVQAVARNLSIEEFPVPLVYLEEKRSFGGSLDDSEQRLAYYRDVFEREMSRWFPDAEPAIQDAGCSERAK